MQHVLLLKHVIPELESKVSFTLLEVESFSSTFVDIHVYKIFLFTRMLRGSCMIVLKRKQLKQVKNIHALQNPSAVAMCRIARF